MSQKTSSTEEPAGKPAEDPTHGGHEAAAMEHGDHAPAQSHGDHGGGGGHEGHTVDHTGHEQMFRRRFWVSLALSIPVLIFSPTLQSWFGFSLPAFPGSQWITPVFALVVFAYGGVPFLQHGCAGDPRAHSRA